MAAQVKALSPLMTPTEVAHLWRVTPRTVKARCKHGAPKLNRVEPLFMDPDLRWEREAVYADLDRCRLERVSVIAVIRGRERRKA